MTKLLIILLLTVGYFIARRILVERIGTLGERKQVVQLRIDYLKKVAQIALFTLLVFAVCLVLGLGYGDLTVLLSSAFAVIGIAFFAQWSILSNITASVVIFFGFPYRVGDRVKVTDPDFDLSGTVEEISLFHVLIRTDENNIITYPNSLILQKPVIKLAPGNTEFPGKLFAAAPNPGYRSLSRKIRGDSSAGPR